MDAFLKTVAARDRGLADLLPGINKGTEAWSDDVPVVPIAAMRKGGVMPAFCLWQKWYSGA